VGWDKGEMVLVSCWHEPVEVTGVADCDVYMGVVGEAAPSGGVCGGTIVEAFVCCEKLFGARG
jgi:hypothetical protein